MKEINDEEMLKSNNNFDNQKKYIEVNEKRRIIDLELERISNNIAIIYRKI